MQQSRFYNKLCEIVKLALTYLLIVRPNVTWTSAIRVFLTHLNTVQADTETESETDACLCHVRLCVLIKWTTRQWLNRQPCTTHFLWVQRSLLWAWSRAQPGRLSSRPPPHRSLTNHCRHQPPPVNAIWRFKLGRALRSNPQFNCCVNQSWMNVYLGMGEEISREPFQEGSQRKGGLLLDWHHLKTSNKISSLYNKLHGNTLML